MPTDPSVSPYQDDDDDDATRITRSASAAPRAAASKPSLVVVYIPMHHASQADLGRRVPIDRVLTIGRQDGNGLVLDQDDVSRRHAEIVHENGTFLLTDLGSSNGTAVNDDPLGTATRELREGDRITIGSTILKFIQGETETEFHDTLYRLKVEDALTRIHNKRFFLEVLERELARSRRHGSPLCLTIYDLDHFKRINDTRGHLAGDAVLRDSAALVKTHVRREDCFARYGGEEFALVHPDTDLAGARIAAEKIRSAIEAATFTFGGERIPVTVSLGIAELAPELADATAFIGLADARLYKAKQAGRNRACSD